MENPKYEKDAPIFIDFLGVNFFSGFLIYARSAFLTSEIASLVRNALYINLGIKFENEYISKCNPTICIIFIFDFFGKMR